ncbi:hypothetical protein Ciccas_014311, partial [Cichlidogyrus casuarinus]
MVSDSTQTELSPTEDRAAETEADPETLELALKLKRVEAELKETKRALARAHSDVWRIEESARNWHRSVKNAQAKNEALDEELRRLKSEVEKLKIQAVKNDKQNVQMIEDLQSRLENEKEKQSRMEEQQRSEQNILKKML